MADSKLFTRKRGGLKSSLTNFVKFVENLKNNDILSDVDTIQLQDRLSRIEGVSIEFNEIQNEIEAIVDDDVMDEQYKERANFEDSFHSIVAIAKSLLPTGKNENQNNQQSAHSSFNSSSKSTSSNNKVAVKLPDIPLTSFKGTYERWLEFRDTFESLIHQNHDLSGIQKFHYLRASLEGTAFEVIRSVEFSENGYTVAWSALCDRFNNKRLLVHNHVKSLFSLENIQRESSAKIRNLIDELFMHLRSLEQLNHDTSNWDTLLIFMLTSKLDHKTLSDWEKHSAGVAMPRLTDFTNFLKERANFLETIEYKGNNKQGEFSKQNKTNIRDKTSFKALLGSKFSCYYCNKDHSIYYCDKFLNLSFNKKVDFVKGKKLCQNCLRDNHVTKKCKLGPCKRCKSWHNTLLHPETQDGPITNKSESNDTFKTEQNTSALGSSIHSNNYSNRILLSTAQIKLIDTQGKPHYVRALLDCGSQSSFITLDICEKMGLNKQKTNLSVFGIANSESKIKHQCKVKIHSLHSNFKRQITCFVLPEITNISACYNVPYSSLNIPKNLKLADPKFLDSGSIDMLIGADLFWTILGSNKISCGKNLPILQETELGWIVSGTIGESRAKGNQNFTRCNLTTHQELHRVISKFWEIEETSVLKPLSKDEIKCEKIFSDTTRRDSDGRFIVTIPLKQPAESLGLSRTQAKNRFLSIERKLKKSQVLCDRYVEFMTEYATLNHMSVDNEDRDETSIEYYLPHHGVLREDSLTTKLRVVFDASAPSSNGLSLNNIQIVGPVLQDDLFSILLRFRKHVYVISADIAKMYRQILIEPEQRNLQKILWRHPDSTDEIKSYTLNTVTYGQASSSFLAIRCLFELANECEEYSPEIANIIRHDFYVDDLLTGANSVEHAQYICREVSKVLKAGCFELRKWHSNNPEVLKNIKVSDISCGILEFSSDESIKTLGLTWYSHNDSLVYNIDQQLINFKQKCTKRTILSAIAKLFDPLGLLCPYITLMKIFMQRLWCEKLSWDDILPNQLAIQWNRFREGLIDLNDLKIPRQVLCKNPVSIDLHGFSDASEQAYGTCIYLRSTDCDGNVHVNLLCAKSKVAPIKSLTIPKLELCAALLLARLADKVIKSMNINFNNCVFWSDSTITLAWIKTAPNLLKIFVGNRVAEIQSLTQEQEWQYVPSLDNPADYLSRGLYPNQILNKGNWWHGPSWLKQDASKWPSIQTKIEQLPELKPQNISSFPVVTLNEFPFERFSKLSRMQRTAAYIIRFKNNCFKSDLQRERGPLTVPELQYALKCLIKASQKQSFLDEFLKLSSKEVLNSKNKLASFAPFLDSENIIRVGGRLKHSDFSINKKYPMILDSKHHFTKLLFEHEHQRLLHAGPQLLLSSIREDYWVIAGRNLARKAVRKCLRCFRFNPETIKPIMGNLPRDRITPSSPFHVTGVDYAGPFSIRKGRGCKMEKCYVGLFVCFSTKALHLELISNLSTNSFMQALRRFVSRRGKPTKLVSDNGTTFVGAYRELGEFLKSNKDELITASSLHQINWSFIPPYSPHFGGLWEAGVKSVKHHLKRILANVPLTFEEFNTTLCQIEAILNSRPICPLSSDPNDFLPLTPAHFLIGRSLVAAPDENLEEAKVNRLSRFQLVQKLCQHFWRRWEKDFISEMQQRQKWKSNQGHLSEGTLVLIKGEQSLPMEWKLGRIVKLHQGSDEISRVASIQTANGIIKRSFLKICPLPIDD